MRLDDNTAKVKYMVHVHGCSMAAISYEIKNLQKSDLFKRLNFGLIGDSLHYWYFLTLLYIWTRLKPLN